MTAKEKLTSSKSKTPPRRGFFLAKFPPKLSKDLLGLKDLTRDQIVEILETATRMKARLAASDQKLDDLKGRAVINLFFEPSTRTRASFELAARRLSADLMTMTPQASSLTKGESLKDMVENLEAMGPALLVVRHAASGVPGLISHYTKAAVINAGDGSHEHPTQGLLDLFTVCEALRQPRQSRMPAKIGGRILSPPDTPHRGDLVVHHYRDVTEEKRLQRKLIQSEKMAAIGMLAGGVAHEINNPLAGILAFAQLLKNEVINPEAQGDLNEIEQAAKRCKKIVEDLLMFARPHGESELKEVSLVDALDQILPLAKLNLKHRNVGLATEYAENLPGARGNPARLQQVFLNLINNAAQSMETGGEVGVRIFQSPDRSQIVVEVRDRGCGIREEDMAKIFDPFYTAKGREGTGLGLSICYSIISEHGGKLEVESELGVGSVFRVILPAVQEAKHGKIHSGH